jgi:hypothetical protein
MFFPFSPRDLLPPYWINRGAVAISTLAGALLATAAERSALLAPMGPFILGLTVIFWATATWWIPMLLVLGVWRHRVRAEHWLAGPMLGVVGLGTLLWLIGSFTYLSGGMDLDPDDPELYT